MTALFLALACTARELYTEGTGSAKPAWKCRAACAEHSGQNLLPVVVCRLSTQIDRARVVTESEKHGSHVPKSFFFFLVVIYGANEPVH